MLLSSWVLDVGGWKNLTKSHKITQNLTKWDLWEKKWEKWDFFVRFCEIFSHKTPFVRFFSLWDFFVRFCGENVRFFEILCDFSRKMWGFVRKWEYMWVWIFELHLEEESLNSLFLQIYSKGISRTTSIGHTGIGRCFK